MTTRTTRSSGLGPPAAPPSPLKQQTAGRKHLQSNTAASGPSQALSRTTPMMPGPVERSPRRRERARRRGRDAQGEEKRGKAGALLLYAAARGLTHPPHHHLNRKMDTQHAAEDAVKNAKGAPAKLTPVECKLKAQGTSVAPSGCPARSPMASFLPPCPTIRSSRARVVREPEITAEDGGETGEEDEGSDDGDDSDSDNGNSDNGSNEAESDGDGYEEGDGDSDGYEEHNVDTKTTTTAKANTHDDDDAESARGHGRTAPKAPGAVTRGQQMASTTSAVTAVHLPVRFGPPKSKAKMKSRPDQTMQPTSTAGAEGIVEGPAHRRHTSQPLSTAGDDGGDVKMALPDIVIANLAPPKAQPPANGSSPASGGILRGRALGNIHNFGDPDPFDMNNFVQVEGRVNLTIVPEPPKSLVVADPISVIKVLSHCHSTMGPLLERVARAYSLVCKNNHHIYVLHKDQWSMMGCFDIAVEDNEPCTWVQDENGMVTHLLVENETLAASAIPPSFHSRRSSSLGAHSWAASVPQSSSAVSGSRASSVVSTDQFGSSGGGPLKLSRAKKDFILMFLGIDTELPYLEPPGLSSAFRKWKAIESAIDQIINLRKNQEWKALVEEDPWYIIIPDFINIFVSKSQFYQT
ncbi:hypothetical protein BDZ97DRAFT_1911938 [Flammula alnicola]|nr:hypothetical protein BDZ97DRAFT_1911938 [Flammula alnicola]